MTALTDTDLFAALTQVKQFTPMLAQALADHISTRAKEHADLAARLAEVERDAARYQWLRRLDAGGIQVYVGGDDASVFGNDLDAAIDAAMATTDSADVALTPSQQMAAAGYTRRPALPKDWTAEDDSASVGQE